MTILAHDLDVIAPPLMFSSPFSPSMISRPSTSPPRYHPATALSSRPAHHPAPTTTTTAAKTKSPPPSTPHTMTPAHPNTSATLACRRRRRTPSTPPPLSRTASLFRNGLQ
ncbi:hypothetical protein DFH09DRAFT_1305884 [Mycena vulgaris]|nr:hypothetical protein DFH09DRAFT_1305884 [Mycena vulgaris]